MNRRSQHEDSQTITLSSDSSLSKSSDSLTPWKHESAQVDNRQQRIYTFKQQLQETSTTSDDSSLDLLPNLSSRHREPLSNRQSVAALQEGNLSKKSIEISPRLSLVSKPPMKPQQQQNPSLNMLSLDSLRLRTRQSDASFINPVSLSARAVSPVCLSTRIVSPANLTARVSIDQLSQRTAMTTLASNLTNRSSHRDNQSTSKTRRNSAKKTVYVSPKLDRSSSVSRLPSSKKPKQKKPKKNSVGLSSQDLSVAQVMKLRETVLSLQQTNEELSRRVKQLEEDNNNFEFIQKTSQLLTSYNQLKEDFNQLYAQLVASQTVNKSLTAQIQQAVAQPKQNDRNTGLMQFIDQQDKIISRLSSELELKRQEGSNIIQALFIQKELPVSVSLMQDTQKYEEVVINEIAIIVKENQKYKSFTKDFKMKMHQLCGSGGLPVNATLKDCWREFQTRIQLMSQKHFDDSRIDATSLAKKLSETWNQLPYD